MKSSTLVVQIASLALAVTLGMMKPAHAGIHVGAGTADEHNGDGATAASIAWRGQQRHPWEVMVGHIGQREDGNAEETWYLAGSKRFYWRQWFVSGGLAWANVDNDILSGHGQFITGAGRDLGRLSVSLRHLSNASTKGRNRGETLLMLEYRIGQ
ncbi:MAG: acyloxyacyl hydrolase [Lysobacter sp.]|nr:acyloxyacyl hydrolase [Lysobacter sp.]